MMEPDDFYLYLPGNFCVWMLTRERWINAGVKVAVGEEGFDWIASHQSVGQMVWAPGEPILIPGRLIVGQGYWIDAPGVTCLNLYREDGEYKGLPSNLRSYVRTLKARKARRTGNVVDLKTAIARRRA